MSNRYLERAGREERIDHRSNAARVLIFCYQLSHIRGRKTHIQKSLDVWQPELERYTGLAQQLTMHRNQEQHRNPFSKRKRNDLER